jgi:hypothetical protein
MATHAARTFAQEDLYLLRGPRVYRVSVVKAHDSGTAPMPGAESRRHG